jgi:hypothetical protein
VAGGRAVKGEPGHFAVAGDMARPPAAMTANGVSARSTVVIQGEAAEAAAVREMKQGARWGGGCGERAGKSGGDGSKGGAD